MKIDREIRTLICDLDGTLMNPGGGIRVSERVCNGLRRLQELGVMIILASARAFQGVLPVALQIGMEEHGGYVIAQNGTLAYDVREKKTLFVHAMAREDGLRMWEEALRLNVDLAIAQPSGMVASGFREGFILDWKNCEVDYLFTFHPQRHIGDELWKCSVSADPAQLDAVFAQLASRIEAIGAYQVVRSTDTIIDITPQGCSKAAAVEAVLDMLGRSFDDAAAIGDGGSDVQLIRRSGLGVTLENGSAECRQAAQLIVPGCEQEGCMTLIDALIAQKEREKTR